MPYQFTGAFDAESRAAFREKRERHGFTRYALANLFGVDEVTIKRWEQGPTVKVTEATRLIIQDFLNGKLDVRLSKPAVVERKISMPLPMRKRLEKLARIYASCSAFPDLQNEICASLNAVVDKYAKQ